MVRKKVNKLSMYTSYFCFFLYAVVINIWHILAQLPKAATAVKCDAESLSWRLNFNKYLVA